MGYIPYRDSKLTRLLQPSLGGNAQITIICTVTAALLSVDETVNTLKFANRAKRIKNHASINETSNEKVCIFVEGLQCVLGCATSPGVIGCVQFVFCGDFNNDFGFTAMFFRLHDV